MNLPNHWSRPKQLPILLPPLFLTIGGICLVICFTTIFWLPTLSFANELVASTPSENPVIDKQIGLSFIEYSIAAYSPEIIEKTLTESQAVGVTWLTFVVNQYQYDVNSTVIYPTVKTARDTDLSAAIQRAHELGMKVTLKPHVDIESSTLWRGNIGQGFDEAAWAAWFESYRGFINHYAELAADTGVEQLVIGTELRNTSGREAEWRALIAGVRQRFDGDLTYSANHSSEEMSITWWDALDAIGISAYYPLTLASDQEPTVGALEDAWQPHLTTLNGLANRWNKPIIFTEIGYRSTSGSHNEPWCHTCGSGIDHQVQMNAYEAFYNVVYQQEWLHGMYWWGWNVDIAQSGPCDGEYSPYNKPAENILRANHGVSTRALTADCASAPTATPSQLQPTATPPMPPAPPNTGYVLVDNFDLLDLGLAVQQNDWQALGDVRIVADPTGNSVQGTTNQVMKARGENALAHRSLPFGITTQSNQGTIHFRILRDGPIDSSSGASAQQEPIDFPGFEAQLAVQSGEPETFRARDGSAFVSLNGTFAANQWYCVWIVSEMASQSYELFISGGQFEAPTQLSADGGSSFNFRNGNSDALRTFYLRMGYDLGYSLYLDDVYADATARNLTSPLSSCGSTAEPPSVTPTPLPNPTLPSVTPSASPTSNPTSNPTLSPTSSPTVVTEQTATPAATAPVGSAPSREIYLPIVE